MAKKTLKTTSLTENPELSIETRKRSPENQGFETKPLFIKAGLYYLAKYRNVRKQPFYQRYVVCELLKAKGNEFFNEDKIQAAVRNYEQALSIFRYINTNNVNWKSEGIDEKELEYIEYEGQTREEKSQVKNIKVALYNNLAACYLKLNDYKNTEAACDEALAIDPSQLKALYRRAKALSLQTNASIESYKTALEDLKKAYYLSPTDYNIQQAILEIKQKMDKLCSNREIFKGIFCEKKAYLGQ